MMKFILLVSIVMLTSFSLSAQGPAAFGQLTVQTFKLGASNTYSGSRSTTFGGDTASTTKFAAIRAITNWANGRLAEMFNYVNTTVAGVSALPFTIDSSLTMSGGTLGLNPRRQLTFDTLVVKTLTGRGLIPFVGYGGQAGVTTTADIQITGTDAGGEVTLTAGTSPVAPDPLQPTQTIMWIIQYRKSFAGTVPYVIITPSNANAAALTGIFIQFRSTSFIHVASIGSTLVTGTVYKWTYHVIQ